MQEGWFRPPPEVVKPIRPNPEVTRRVEVQEGAAFSAFMGAHQQAKQKVGG